MSGSQGGRFQWGSYGFLAGILLGVLMGWFFAGFVGAFIRVAIVALVDRPGRSRLPGLAQVRRAVVAAAGRALTTWGRSTRLRPGRSFRELCRIRGRGDLGARKIS